MVAWNVSEDGARTHDASTRPTSTPSHLHISPGRRFSAQRLLQRLIGDLYTVSLAHARHDAYSSRCYAHTIPDRDARAARHADGHAVASKPYANG